MLNPQYLVHGDASHHVTLWSGRGAGARGAVGLLFLAGRGHEVLALAGEAEHHGAAERHELLHELPVRNGGRHRDAVQLHHVVADL